MLINIERVPPNRYRVRFEGKEIGVWKDPECSAARHLLDNGFAKPEDILQTNRGLVGSVGWFAKHRVDETATPRFVKWKPMPKIHGAGNTVEAQLDASEGNDTSHG